MRELFCVIKHEDAEGIKQIVLLEKNDELVSQMKTLIKLLKLQIKDIESEQKTLESRGTS